VEGKRYIYFWVGCLGHVTELGFNPCTNPLHLWDQWLYFNIKLVVVCLMEIGEFISSIFVVLAKIF
jgi:hypothetical protein